MHKLHRSTSLSYPSRLSSSPAGTKSEARASDPVALPSPAATGTAGAVPLTAPATNFGAAASPLTCLPASSPGERGEGGSFGIYATLFTSGRTPCPPIPTQNCKASPARRPGWRRRSGCRSARWCARSTRPTARPSSCRRRAPLPPSGASRMSRPCASSTACSTAAARRSI
ncbi:MAG: hypothetical protein E5X51_25765 [Mesorhizobium sp.]|nr:MAG: hypothetical protein E5X51_25765 [Mesorhizobium sp.]